MRKFLIIILSSLALISCDKKTKDFAGNFIKAINENDRVAIVSMYPDAKNFDIASPIVEDSKAIKIEKSENGHKIIHIGDISLDVCKNSDGRLNVNDSWGLLNISNGMRNFAISTGWIKTELSDKENAIALSDKGFTPYIINTFKDKLQLKAKISSQESQGASYWDVVTNVIVTNNTDTDIPGELYNVVVTYEGITGEEYNAYGEFIGYGFKYYHKTVGGVNVPAHGKATIFIDRADAEYGPDYKKATIKFNKGCDVSKLEYSFTGKEYENYLATKK